MATEAKRDLQPSNNTNKCKSNSHWWIMGHYNKNRYWLVWYATTNSCVKNITKFSNNHPWSITSWGQCTHTSLKSCNQSGGNRWNICHLYGLQDIGSSSTKWFNRWTNIMESRGRCEKIHWDDEGSKSRYKNKPHTRSDSHSHIK